MPTTFIRACAATTASTAIFSTSKRCANLAAIASSCLRSPPASRLAEKASFASKIQGEFCARNSTFVAFGIVDSATSCARGTSTTRDTPDSKDRATAAQQLLLRCTKINAPFSSFSYRHVGCSYSFREEDVGGRIENITTSPCCFRPRPFQIFEQRLSSSRFSRWPRRSLGERFCSRGSRRVPRRRFRRAGRVRWWLRGGLGWRTW